MPSLEIRTATSRCPIRIERGALRRVAALAREAGVSPTAAAVVVDDAIEATHGAAVHASLQGAGVRALRIAVRASEDDKRLSTVEDLCERMLRAGLDRRSALVAVGGGVVGDTAGLAAALFMRGIALVQVPTTLLAMVDAALGGKTAVNLPRADGSLAKNMVGAFWQPRLVVCDPEALGSLPARDLRCGLAECVKHAVLADPALLDWMIAHRDALHAADPDTLATLVERSAAVKVAVVNRDEREEGDRALLNLGHTFAHALESLDHATVRHGEAVAIGLVAAAHVGAIAGLASPELAQRLAKALEALGLPTRVPGHHAARDLLAAMRDDKKSVGGSLRLVVPRAVGDVRVETGVTDDQVLEAWRRVGA